MTEPATTLSIKTLRIMIFSITTLRIMIFSITTLRIMTFGTIVNELSLLTLSRTAEHYYAECHL